VAAGLGVLGARRGFFVLFVMGVVSCSARCSVIRSHSQRWHW